MQYQGFGMYDKTRPGSLVPVSGPPPRPPRKNRGPIIAAVALGTVVLLAMVITVVLVNTSGNDNQANQLPPPATSESETPPTTSASETTATAESAVATPDPIIAGWQAVTVPKRGAVYDAPADWELERPDNIIAFGPPEDALTLTGVAIYKKGFCPQHPNSHRALTGSTARKGANDAEVATKTARKAAELAYSSDLQPPRVILGKPENITLDQGTAPAVRVTAWAIHPQPGPCDAPRGLISVIARNNDGDSSVVHVGMAEQDVPDALPPEALKTIGSSFRPLD